MKYTSSKNGNGTLQMTITLDADDLAIFEKSAASDKNKDIPLSSISATEFSWGKTDYCVSCNDGNRYTIETYGDIAANLEAAATCLKVSGDPSYGLSKGSCS